MCKEIILELNNSNKNFIKKKTNFDIEYVMDMYLNIYLTSYL